MNNEQQKICTTHNKYIPCQECEGIKPMNTPDTEGEKDFFEYFKGNIDGESNLHCNTKYIRNFIQQNISSHTTYWKERMRKEVEGMRIAKGNYNCGEEGCCNPNPKDEREKEDFEWQIGYNTALDTLLDNLK